MPSSVASRARLQLESRAVAAGIKIGRLTFAYGDTSVFEGFRLETTGNPILLRGPSGCGKTTLLKLLTGNLQPEGGAILPHFRRSLLVLQEDALFPWLSGIENLTRILRLEEKVVREHRMFGLVRDFVQKSTHSMSFGQRRLVELFRAVLYAPDFLCLDEPFNYLDPDNRRAAAKHLLGVRERGAQLVISSHYSEDFADLEAPIYSFSGRLPVSELACHAA